VPGCQKITNDGLTRSGIGCFIAVPMATVGVKGLKTRAPQRVGCTWKNKNVGVDLCNIKSDEPEMEREVGVGIRTLCSL